MANTTAPAAPSGLRIREIETVTESYTDDLGQQQTRVVPKLDAAGREIEISAIDVPQHIESEGGDAIEAVIEAARAAGQLPPLSTTTPDVASNALAPVVDHAPPGDEE